MTLGQEWRNKTRQTNESSDDCEARWLILHAEVLKMVRAAMACRYERISRVYQLHDEEVVNGGAVRFFLDHQGQITSSDGLKSVAKRLVDWCLQENISCGLEPEHVFGGHMYFFSLSI